MNGSSPDRDDVVARGLAHGEVGIVLRVGEFLARHRGHALDPEPHDAKLKHDRGDAGCGKRPGEGWLPRRERVGNGEEGTVGWREKAGGGKRGAE